MELDLAILQFLKANAQGVEEMLSLLQAEYRLQFGQPALMDSRLQREYPMGLIWAMDRAIKEGNPDYQSYLQGGQAQKT